MGKHIKKKVLAEYDGYIVYINGRGYPTLAERMYDKPELVKIPVFRDLNHLEEVLFVLFNQLKRKKEVRRNEKRC